MAVPQITPLPPAPQRQDSPSDFVAKADAHVAALTAFTAEANTQADYNDTNAIAADASATASAASAAASANSAAVSAANANFVGAWASQAGAANIPYSVSHDNKSWQLINNLADVTTSEPGVTGDWLRIFFGRESDYLQTGELVAGKDWMADPTSATVTRDTPTSPGDGDEIGAIDDTKTATSAKMVVIGYNASETIMGLTEDLNITTKGQGCRLRYDASNTDWRLVP